MKKSSQMVNTYQYKVNLNILAYQRKSKLVKYVYGRENKIVYENMYSPINGIYVKTI